MDRPDVDIVADPKTKALRAQASTFIPAIKLQAPSMLPNLPSYIREPLKQLLDGMDRWEKDERNCA